MHAKLHYYTQTLVIKARSQIADKTGFAIGAIGGGRRHWRLKLTTVLPFSAFLSNTRGCNKSRVWCARIGRSKLGM